jgi:hypothetical protein
MKVWIVMEVFVAWIKISRLADLPTRGGPKAGRSLIRNSSFFAKVPSRRGSIPELQRVGKRPKSLNLKAPQRNRPVKKTQPKPKMARKTAPFSKLKVSAS